MKKPEPIKLNPAERVDLGSITHHPGLMVVLKILRYHMHQTMTSIFDIQPDDPQRDVKLRAIGETAYAQKLNISTLEAEIQRNKDLLQQEEAARQAAIRKGAQGSN
jgi:hypothetical protein